MTGAPRIPGVHVGQRLGQGRFGEVHAGRDAALGRRVAIKLLPRVDELVVAEFAALAHKVVAASPHPGVVTVTGWLRADDGRIGVVAEQMVTSLADHVAAQGPLTVRDAVGVGGRLAAGLAALHAADVIHADVRPSNVMIDRWGRPQLADAGIAAFCSRSLGLPRALAPVATVAHLPPEVLADGPATPASDTFGLAATLYTLVAGQPPFAHGVVDPDAVIAAIRQGAVEDLRGRGMPDPIWSALWRGLAADPSDRPPTPQRLAEALTAAASLGAMGAGETMGRLTPAQEPASAPALEPPLAPAPEPPPLPVPEPPTVSPPPPDATPEPTSPPLPVGPPRPAAAPSRWRGRVGLAAAGGLCVLLVALLVLWPRPRTGTPAPPATVAAQDPVVAPTTPVPATAPSPTATATPLPAPTPVPPPHAIPLAGPDAPAPFGVEVLAGRGLGVAGPATGLHLARGEGVAVAHDGSLVLADRAAHRVYRVTPDGTVHVLAGTGHPGDAGEGGPADRAQLNDPYGVALDGDTVLITDRGNGLIRRVDPDGTIHTVAGGTAGSRFSVDTPPHGIAVAVDGTVYATIVAEGLVVEVAPDGQERVIAGSGVLGSSGDGGPALAARLDAPTGVAVDGEDLVVVELGQRASGNQGPTGRARRLRHEADGQWRVDAEPGAEGFNRPEGIAVGPDGTVVVADTFNDRVVAIDDGQPRILASSLSRPKAVAAGPGVEVLVSEGAAPHVRRIATDGTVATVVGRAAPTGPVDATEVGLVLPNGIALAPAGGVVIGDLATQDVVELVDGVVRSRTDGTSTIGAPGGMTVDASGAVYITDPPRHVVYRLGTDGVLEVVAGQLAQRPVETTEQAIRDGQPATDAFLSFPRGLDWHEGTLYVADSLANRVRAIGPDGVIRTVAGGDGALNLPHDVDVRDGRIVVADAGSHTVKQVELATGVVRTIAGAVDQPGSGGGDGPAGDVRLSFPQAAVWLADGSVAIADARNMRVLVVDGERSRVVLGGAGSALPDLRPVALAADPDTGRLFVVDQVARRVWSVQP